MKAYQYLICATLFLLPFQKHLFSFEVSVFTFNPHLIGLYCSFILILLTHIFSTKKFNFTILDLLLILFCISFLISTVFFAKDVMKSSQMAYKAIFIPVILYITIKLSIKDHEQFKKLFLSLLAGIVLMAILGIFQGKLNPVRQNFFGMGPVNTATFLSIPIISIIYLGWWKKAIGFIPLLLCLTLFFLTFSRMYFLGLLISPFIFILTKRGHILKIFAFIFPIFFLFIIILSFNQDYFRAKYVPKREMGTIQRVL